jgi:hypothetical protein
MAKPTQSSAYCLSYRKHNGFAGKVVDESSLITNGIDSINFSTLQSETTSNHYLLKVNW